MSSVADVAIRAATPGDVSLILAFIRELAEYERMSGECVATEGALRDTLFGAQPRAEVLIAEVDDEPAGCALFFHTYSTFLAQPGLYLEDLYVRPPHRRRGVGQALLTELAAVAFERGCGRFEWTVLDWNADARRFYESVGARPMSDWITHRLTGASLEALASAGRASRAGRGTR